MVKPKVSVVVLDHEDSTHLGRAIDSVLAQTYDNTEIIVVCDWLSSNTVHDDIIKSYGDKIKYYKKRDGGVAAALNFGIKKATGNYFAWLSHDDVYMPESLEKQVALVGDGANVVVVSDWVMVNDNNRKIRSYAIDSRVERYPDSFLAFASDAQLNTCAMLAPMAMLKASGLFNESFPSVRDYKLFNRMIADGAKLRVVSQPLLNYAAHSEDRYLGDAKIGADYDFVHSDLIGMLSYDAIVAYFGDRDGALKHYKDMLAAGRPRSAAFLMRKIIAGCLDQGYDRVAKETLLRDLSGLLASQMAASTDSLIEKMKHPGSKKKLLFCSGHWLTGGMERVMSTLFLELANDYEIFLITPHDDRQSHIAIPDHVTSIKIADKHFQMHFDAVILAYALLLDIDVVIGYMNLFEKQLSAYQLCVGTKIKTIASNHEYYFYPYKSPTHYGVVKKRLDAYKTCSAIVWPNEFNAVLCGMYVKNNYIIGNPNKFEVSQESAVQPREKVVIAVGRFNDYVKRIDRILECFALVRKDSPDARLVLVGKCDNDQPIGPNTSVTVAELLRKLAIPEASVHFVGEVSNMEDYYASARVLVLTSNSEGFGMVLNEAACFGVPAVSNFIPGIEDIIVDGENGYITEQGDIASMAAKVVSILDDDALWLRLSADAKRKVARYDSKHIGDKWRCLIDALTENAGDSALYEKLRISPSHNIDKQEVLVRVLSQELNDIFYMATNGNGAYAGGAKPPTLLRKVGRLPARLKTNIEYEGLPKTVHKVAARSYRIVKRKMKLQA